MRLPDSWVNEIFARLFGSFGSLLTSKYSRVENGVDVGMAQAKKTWAETLGGFSDKPEAIAYALKNLPPDYPPNDGQFANLCREAARRMVPDVPRLDIKYDAGKAKRFADELAEIVNSANRGSDPRFWATHPKGRLAFDCIRGAAENNPVVFRPCIDHLIAEGRVSVDGKHLLEKYTGNGAW